MFNPLKKFKDFFQKKSDELVLIGLVFVGLILITFLFFVLLLPSLSDIKKGVVAWHFEITQNAKGKIEGFLNENINTLNDLAQILGIEENYEKKVIFIERFLKEKKDFSQIVIINRSGQEILKISRSLVFTPQDFKDQSWSEIFVRPMEGKIYLGPVYFSEKSVPYITLSLPIEPSPGQITGVLVAELDLNEIWDIVSVIKVGTRGQVYLVDSRGYLIAHPDTYLVLKETNLLRRKAVEKVIIKKQKVSGLEKGEEYFNEEGEKVYVVGLPLEKIGWGVFVEEPVKDTWASYRRTRNLGLISIFGSAILFLILFFIIQALIRTFHSLQSSQKALKEAKETLEIKVEARTKELKELTDRQEEIIKERTKELQGKIDEMERFQRLTVGREITMIELKKEIKRLKEEIEKYKPR